MHLSPMACRMLALTFALMTLFLIVMALIPKASINTFILLGLAGCCGFGSYEFAKHMP